MVLHNDLGNFVEPIHGKQNFPELPTCSDNQVKIGFAFSYCREGYKSISCILKIDNGRDSPIFKSTTVTC